MKSQRVWITLSEALSWLAFGQLLPRQDLLRKLAGAGYNSAMMSALRDALAELMDKAGDDAVGLRGKAVMASDDKGASGQTAVILAVQLADYRAFDITTDGLRYGHGLLWLPEEGHAVAGSLVSSLPTLLRPEHYVSVSVDFPGLQRVSRAGRSRTPLRDAALRQWWIGLSEGDRGASEARHRDMLEQAFPENDLSRERLRAVRSELPRRRGRTKKSP
jgi:hypothetical protein